MPETLGKIACSVRPLTTGAVGAPKRGTPKRAGTCVSSVWKHRESSSREDEKPSCLSTEAVATPTGKGGNCI